MKPKHVAMHYVRVPILLCLTLALSACSPRPLATTPTPVAADSTKKGHSAGYWIIAAGLAVGVFLIVRNIK